jgi:hypothetical protein
MKIAMIRTLIVIIQMILLFIQMATGIKWLFIPIVLLMIICLALREFEE